MGNAVTRHLSSATHLAVIGSDIVILDARENAYFCLAGAATEVRVRAEGVVFDDDALAEDFDQAGFLAETPNPPRILPTTATQDLALTVARPVKALDLALILGAWVTMAFSYHTLPFDRLVARAQRGRRRAPTQKLDRGAANLVATFERVLPWLPFQELCLYRAFLLLKILRWRGLEARWMFGVRTWPFQAHCWLQVGDTALDDTADRLAGFTPILAV